MGIMHRFREAFGDSGSHEYSSSRDEELGDSRSLLEARERNTRTTLERAVANKEASNPNDQGNTWDLKVQRAREAHQDAVDALANYDRTNSDKSIS